MPLQGLLVGKIKQAAEDHKLYDWISPPAGQGVGFIRELKPARQVVMDMVEEAYDALERLQLGEAIGT